MRGWAVGKCAGEFPGWETDGTAAGGVSFSGDEEGYGGRVPRTVVELLVRMSSVPYALRRDRPRRETRPGPACQVPRGEEASPARYAPFFSCRP